MQSWSPSSQCRYHSASFRAPACRGRGSVSELLVWSYKPCKHYLDHNLHVCGLHMLYHKGCVATPTWFAPGMSTFFLTVTSPRSSWSDTSHTFPQILVDVIGTAQVHHNGEKHGAHLCNTCVNNTINCNTIGLSYNTIHAMQYNTVMQCNTIEYSNAMQCNTAMQYNAIQYKYSNAIYYSNAI